MPKKRSNGEGALQETSERPLGVYDYDGLPTQRKEKIQKFLCQNAERSFAEGQGLPDGYGLRPGHGEEGTDFCGVGAVVVRRIQGPGLTHHIRRLPLHAQDAQEGLRSHAAQEYQSRGCRGFPCASLIAEGKHQSQASKCRGMMFQIMRKAQANDLILKNPVELADKTRHAPQKSKKDSFTAEEVRKLFSSLPHDKAGDSIRLLLLTGMRTQELLALEAEHIEPDGSCVHIRQAVKQVKGTVFVGTRRAPQACVTCRFH